MSYCTQEINETKRQRDQDFRTDSETWILQYEQLFTHALTLTFNHTKVRRMMMQQHSSVTLSSSEMVELYKASMRSFKWKLVKSLYGNAWKRFKLPIVFVPILEGLGRDQKPHYHCVVGLPNASHEAIADTVCSIWSKTPFAGNRIDVQPYFSVGWARYTTKNALFANRESIDWENVLVPQPKSHDE